MATIFGCQSVGINPAYTHEATVPNLDQTHVDEDAAIINGQRRRNLGYQRPTGFYAAATVQ